MPRLPAIAAFETPIQVPFYDLDPMNVVWHGRYPQYLEIARCNLLDHVDFNYARMREIGYVFPIVDMRIQYVASAHFAERLIVRAEIVEFEHRLKIRYVIRNAQTSKRVTKAYTSQVAVRLSDGVMQLACPDELVDHLRKWSQTASTV